MKERAGRFLFAWALGGTASFFALGFFQNFFPSLWGFVLFALLLNTTFTPAFEIALEQAIFALRNKPQEKIVPLAILTLGVLWVVFTFRLLIQYPTLFSFDFFLPEPRLIPAFLGSMLLSLPLSVIFLQKLDSTDWRTSSFIIWTKRNLPGLLPASAIFISAYALATVFVSADLALADNYFDTDSPIWINFLTAAPEEALSVRAVHPYVLMLLRPPVWMLSLLLNGDKFHAALLLNAFVGGACVFLTWSFFKQRTNNTSYALLVASLLGYSNSHLLLSVFLESYIFSAAALIASVMLLQRENAKLVRVVPVGLITFGITITNFVQTCITFLLTQRSLRNTLKYVFITIALATALSFTQTLIQPNSQPFYIPSNLTYEAAFQRDLVNVPLSQTISRANVISRTITLFSVVAPRPLILLEEIGCSVPCFNAIRLFQGRYEYASYVGFGSLLARAWFGLLALAASLFLWRAFRSPKNASLQAALALNVLFNFILHMNYGDDPMLYSPNWTYALIFFFGISLEKLADKKWVQIGLLAFVTALLFNNIDLFRRMLDAILPFFG